MTRKAFLPWRVIWVQRKTDFRLEKIICIFRTLQMTRRAFLSSKSNTGAGEMTRRAFLSSKSNTGAGEIQIKWASQKSWQLGWEIEISQNLWIRLTPEQFSYQDQVKTCPGTWSLCLSMRFRKIPLAGCVFAWPRKFEIFMNFWGCNLKIEHSLNFGGPAGGSAPWRVPRPHGRIQHMTRRAVLALRVIQRQGQM